MRTRLRLPVGIGAALVLGAGLAAPLTAQVAANAADDGSWCVSDPTPPCVVAMTRDGELVPPDDPDWDVVVGRSTGASRGGTFVVSPTGGGNPIDLGAGERAHEWSITVEMGTIKPRVVFAYASDLRVERIATGSGTTSRVVVTGNPVRMTDNDECVTSSWPWVCPEIATDQSQAYFGGEITDYGAWTDTAQREAMHGMDYSTNVGVTSVPPELTTDTAGRDQLLLRMANHHAYPGGEVFKGFAHLRIPGRFLRETYGIDDLSTLTSAGVATSLGSGSGTVSVTTDADGVVVDATGITFSTRTLTVRAGKVTPKAPKKVRTKRTTKTRARVTFKKAAARGSTVKGHTVRCTAVKSKHVKRFSTTKRKAVIKKLRKDRAYTCQVRARSAAGKGKWSPPKRLKARPAARR